MHSISASLLLRRVQQSAHVVKRCCVERVSAVFTTPSWNLKKLKGSAADYAIKYQKIYIGPLLLLSDCNYITKQKGRTLMTCWVVVFYFFFFSRVKPHFEKKNKGERRHASDAAQIIDRKPLDLSIAATVRQAMMAQQTTLCGVSAVLTARFPRRGAIISMMHMVSIGCGFALD